MTHNERMLKALESLSEDIAWLKKYSVVKTDLVAERVYTEKIVRKIVHEEIDLNNQVFGTILKVELANATQKTGNELRV